MRAYLEIGTRYKFGYFLLVCFYVGCPNSKGDAPRNIGFEITRHDGKWRSRRIR